MSYPNFLEERKRWRRGCRAVVGLDEAGRGSLAGPVVAAAVSLSAKCKAQSVKLQFKTKNLTIRDSKQLTPRQRERVYKVIIRHPDIKWGVGVVSEKIIDKINILEASKLAMIKALGKLEPKFTQNQALQKFQDFLILDGKMRLDLPIKQKSIVKADVKVFSCAAASIIAKVTRDRLMKSLHRKYPRYRFDIHKGYPTPLHLKYLRRYGSCSSHRQTFRPVSQYTAT